MSALVRQNFSNFSTHLTSLYRTRRPLLISLLTTLLVALALLRTARHDYLLFLSYGPGGVPYNLLGWFISGIILRPLGMNVLDTRAFERDPDKRSWLGEEWPEKKRRRGERPRVGPHPIPQRQLDQPSSREIKEVSDRYYSHFYFLSKPSSANDHPAPPLNTASLNHYNRL
jgi:hypothetical protein